MPEEVHVAALPSTTEIIDCINPGFDTSYPNIVFDERLTALPAGSRFFLDHCWLQGKFPSSVTRVIRLKDVFVTGEGLVFNRDLEIFGESITQQAPDRVVEGRSELEAAILRNEVIERPGPSLLCVKPGQRNYGHWLIEMLPRVMIAAEALPDLRPRILAPSAEDPMRSIIRRSLQLLGVDEDRVAHALVTPEWCEDLIVMRGLTEHGVYMSPLVFHSLDRLADAVPEQSTPDRIFVRRVPPATRCLVNEDEVVARLEERGFVSIRPETMSLDEQIATFRGARQVAGVAGAGLANIAFCRPGCAVTVFFPESMPDTFYWFLAQHRHLTFADIRCRPGPDIRSRLPWDEDIVLDLKVFSWYMR